ncbi:hypothetical protein B0H16DRAFT_1689434 [Mycena metata]|uniref:Uncharacterized protein n=1 Tax=Mycena metata TaxID=1033252 RepID=A0AAD7NDX8_9AGAR|nr:hypothetical protein B0H16DRAFT_1689434 [Mycena metata]
MHVSDSKNPTAAVVPSGSFKLNTRRPPPRLEQCYLPNICLSTIEWNFADVNTRTGGDKAETSNAQVATHIMSDTSPSYAPEHLMAEGLATALKPSQGLKLIQSVASNLAFFRQIGWNFALSRLVIDRLERIDSGDKKPGEIKANCFFHVASDMDSLREGNYPRVGHAPVVGRQTTSNRPLYVGCLRQIERDGNLSGPGK